MHGELLSGVRGEDKLPGQLRSTPVWVGAAGATPDTARFVPPLPEHLPGLLTDWEYFVNEAASLPVLVKCALMHYQFETIHPFLDGNGRIGRLLVGLLLLAEGRLGRPLLYLSGYPETHRTEYYERLQVERARREIGGTTQGARNVVENAVSFGWLRQLGARGQGGRHFWLAEEVFAVVDAPAAY